MKKKHSIRLLTAACIALCLCACASKPKTVYEQIIQNIYDRTCLDVNAEEHAHNGEAFLAQMNADGSFPDFDYADHRQSPWPPSGHPARLLDMVFAYALPQSPLYGDAKLYDGICRGLTFWHQADPRSANRWHQICGWPQSMGWAMCLMRMAPKQLPKEIENNYTTRIMDIAMNPVDFTGVNKQDMALIRLYVALLTEDEKELAFAVNELYQTLACTSDDEGVQFDYSYHMHSRQLYLAGYGSGALTAFFKFAYYLKGTPYEHPEHTEAMGEYLRQGILPIVRGSYTLPNSGGRGQFARPGALSVKGFAAMMEKMAELDSPDRKESYLNAAERISGRQSADFDVQPWHRHYWMSDYTLHQRPSYTFAVRTNSTRTCRCEHGNLENLKGFFVADGSTFVAVDGMEYFNVFPTWNWQHIPGTTVPCLPEVPLDKEWVVHGLCDFTGGVDDGRYGCMTFHYDENRFHIDTHARKSWFCFDNEVVCLGNCVSSTNPNPVHTTLNQCLLQGDITVEDIAGSQATLADGDHQLANVRWLNHRNISYFFPEPTRIAVSGKECRGNWYDINQTCKDEEVTEKVFLAYIDHGLKPRNASYEYYLVPGTKTIDEARSTLDSLTVINTSAVQYVYNHDLNMLQAVFHKADSMEVPVLSPVEVGQVKVDVSVPCVLMITGIGTADAKAYVSDPTFRASEALLHITLPGEPTKTLHAKFHTTKTTLGKTECYAMTSLPDNK